MRKFFFFFISLFILHELCTSVSAASASTSELIAKIDDCIKSEKPQSITDYSCVKGDMLGNGLPLTREQTAYIVIMSVRFKELDEEILKSMQSMQQNRDTDVQKWTSSVEDQYQSNLKKYLAICTPLGWDLVVLQAYMQEKWTLATLGGFPQTFCRDLAPRKAEAWENMGYILASKGISKGYQNSKDIYVDKVKGRYKTLLEKFSSYERIIATAVGKFTAYIKDPVGS